MLCPLHEDVKRSASLNVLTGDFYCQAEGIGMGVTDLIRQRSQWVPPGVAATNGHGSSGSRGSRSAEQEIITEGKISGWQSSLMTSDEPLEILCTRRGLTEETLELFQVGWDRDRKVYTIPVRGPDREIWNVRRYTFNPRNDTKIWSVAGMRTTELYPLWMYMEEDWDDVIVMGGEWDAMITIQNGFHAITRTAAEKIWKPEWSRYFEGKRMFLGHDADFTGVAANKKVYRYLKPVAREVKVIELPYEIVPKRGKDWTDFFLEHDRADAEQLLFSARTPRSRETSGDPEIITVLDSFDAHKVADPVKLAVTIKGKKDPGYSVPKQIKLSCTQDAGPKCNFCPMKGKDGNDTIDIAPGNPSVLGMLDAPSSTIHQQVVFEYGVPGGKCPKLEIEVTEHQSVEVLFARPSVDHGSEQKHGPNAGEYKSIKITSVGRHDTLPNNTILVTGALYPNPRSQVNEFLAWEIERQETSVDRFQVTPEAVKLMQRFQPRKGQRPLKKLAEINRDLSLHVTRIVGRPEMHALMDLTFHSVLAWKFGGKLEHRGWIQSIIIGDTRTGKSDAAVSLVRHFGAGETVGGEAASIAGLVGGLQQIGGKDWAVTWGVIPINDGRIVIIDEFPHPDDISKMSDVLSSGVAKLTKIQQDATLARTRTIWMGNPPQSTMAHFTYGVDAFKAIINTPEDIARFDLAMAVATGDVPEDEINRPIETKGELRYTSEACHTMLMWAWTRKPDQVIWARGAEDEVFKLASEMGKRYIEEPPLVQAANIRIKIARVAVAIAARTFSTDKTHECIVVTKEHVQDAVAFMDRIYEMTTFGYAERSRERLSDFQEAMDNREEVRKFLLERRGLAKFLRSQTKFRRQDLEEVLNYDKDMANATIARLWNARMVRKVGTADIFVEPVLHGLLREVKF